jgi:nucleotide-binding universal stress UspA family protein
MSQNIRTILYATDLGPASDEVLDYAISAAKQLGVNLHVVRVIEDERQKSVVDVDSHVPQETRERYYEDRAERVRKNIEAQIAAWRGKHAYMNPYSVISGIKCSRAMMLPGLFSTKRRRCPRT